MERKCAGAEAVNIVYTRILHKRLWLGKVENLWDFFKSIKCDSVSKPDKTFQKHMMELNIVFQHADEKHFQK